MDQRGEAPRLILLANPEYVYRRWLVLWDLLLYCYHRYIGARNVATRTALMMGLRVARRRRAAEV
jgi:hypothetical protein